MNTGISFAARTHRPVIISLPGGYRQRAREIAPDLWAVRNYSLDLDDIRPLDAGGELETETLAVSEKSSPSVIQNAVALFEEWTRLSLKKRQGGRPC